MPESEYPIREVRELPHVSGVTEIMFPDTDARGCFVGVISSQGEDHVAGVHTLHAGKHCLVTLDADDAIAMARQLFRLSEDESIRNNTRRTLVRMINISMSPEQIVDRLLEHFVMVLRAES